MLYWNGVTAAILLLSTSAFAQRTPEEERNDWPNLQKYAKANAELPQPAPGEERVVFMGNSIFDVWGRYFPTMFPDSGSEAISRPTACTLPRRDIG